MIVIFAEKPDVGNKIAAALGGIILEDGKAISFEDLPRYEKMIKGIQYKNGYLKTKFKGKDVTVTWGYGHLVCLKDAKDYDEDFSSWYKLPMPFVPQSVGLKVAERTGAGKEFNKKVKQQFNLVKKLFNSAECVINATDFDREGEVIFSYVYELAKSSTPVYRACFSSQTKEGIIEGFTKNLRAGKDMLNLTNAGRMRSYADWLVGCNLTVATTLRCNNGNGVLSIGRVQTPTLNILVEREKAIKNFTASKFYTLDAVFEKDGVSFPAEYEDGRFENKEDAEKVKKDIEGIDPIVKNIEYKEASKNVPNLYNLSALQMDANSLFGYSLKKTLEIAQSLYEKGLTTYPRTNSQFLTDDMESKVKSVLSSLKKSSKYSALINGGLHDTPKRFFNSKKVESHFAIIPTGQIPSGLDADQENIYNLIALSLIKTLYDAAKFKKGQITIGVGDRNFVAKSDEVINLGYMVCEKKYEEKILPNLLVGDVLRGCYEVSERETTPPKRFTDKTILKAMLNAGKEIADEDLKKAMADLDIKGIGTEATRANIIDTLIQRGYIERKKKSLVATEKGIALIDAFPITELKSAELTAMWEKRLDNIAIGEVKPEVFKEDIEKITKRWVEEINKMKNTNNAFHKNKNLSAVCPKCGKNIVKYSWGYGCSGYKEGCKFSISGKICEKNITEAVVKELLADRKTRVIKNFKNKVGKSFDARLILDDENKVVFSFDN